jgi:hypothetical protein
LKQRRGQREEEEEAAERTAPEMGQRSSMRRKRRRRRRTRSRPEHPRWIPAMILQAKFLKKSVYSDCVDRMCSDTDF